MCRFCSRSVAGVLVLLTACLLIGSGDSPTQADSAPALFEPPDGFVYHGAAPNPAVVDGYLDALGDPAIAPLIEGVHLGIPGTRPRLLVQAVRDFLDRVGSAGRVPHLSLSMTAGSGVPTDVEIAMTTQHDALIDQIVEAVAAYEGPLFLRFGFEFNGAWNAYTAGIYPVAFRKIVDRFRAAGVTNAAVIWCYEPDAPGDFDALMDGEPAWYPGDDVVDWFGIDFFGADHFDPAAAGRVGRETDYDKTVRFLDMALAHGKPVMISELAPVKVYVTPTDTDPGLADGRADWSSWYAKLFAFMDAHPEIKGFLYMNHDYRGTVYDEKNAWGDCRIEVNRFILEHYCEILSQPRFLHQTHGLWIE